MRALGAWLPPLRRRTAKRQHHLADGAAVGVNWKMKRRSRRAPGAALRAGVSGKDWDGQWFAAMVQVGLSGPDYLLGTPALDLR
eukprot:7940688-Pyramimonas_sp.AAC.1